MFMSIISLPDDDEQILLIITWEPLKILSGEYPDPCVFQDDPKF